MAIPNAVPISSPINKDDLRAKCSAHSLVENAAIAKRSEKVHPTADHHEIPTSSATSPDMEDAVRISASKFRSTYETSFKIWAQLHSHVVANPSLPVRFLSLQDAFPAHPFFPRNLKLKKTNFQVFATGSSVWGTGAKCDRPMPPFKQKVEIEVGRMKPVSLVIADTAPPNATHEFWFASKDNYLVVLILAWAYILSARWTEIMPGSCSITYSTCERRDSATAPDEQEGQDAIKIDIGEADLREAQWWDAVLAPGEGWQATMTLGEKSFNAPWSRCVQQSSRFVLSQPTTSQDAHLTASFSDACSYLTKFCERHNIIDQSHAALSAVLLFPTMGARTLQLPPPVVTKPTAPLPPPLPRNLPNSDWIHQQPHHLDKLIILSCNTRGIRSLLLNIFYNPSIPCNAATPWIEGALTAINTLASNNPYLLGRMCMERSPKTASLWLGVTILGLHKTILQDVRCGRPVDLHGAAWSDTVQTFLQEPVSSPLASDGRVTRADECRMLFLSRSDFMHGGVPAAVWRPFGTTPVEDVDVEVWVHKECGGHRFEYRGVYWDCTGGESDFQPARATDTDMSVTRLLMDDIDSTKEVTVDYKGLNRDKEAISENATRNIFNWLRFDGIAPHETDIWKHEWFEDDDSDEECEEEAEERSEKGRKVSSRVKLWLADLKTSGYSHDMDSRQTNVASLEKGLDCVSRPKRIKIYK